jgi:hypothetical protein
LQNSTEAVSPNSAAADEDSFTWEAKANHKRRRRCESNDAVKKTQDTQGS